jgi:regulator of replication initiation timing
LLAACSQNVKDEAYKIVDENKVIDITLDHYQETLGEISREKLKTTGSVIQVKNSLISLPLCTIDLIQKTIFVEEGYFEENLLQYYTKVFLGGLSVHL